MENKSISNNSDSIIAENVKEINDVKIKAIRKLDSEAEHASGQNVPAVGIYHYIRRKIEEDESDAFAKFVLAKKLSNCFSYVTEHFMEIAKKAAKGNGTRNNPEVVGVGASSDEIFALVDEFYSTPDEEIKKRAKEKKAREEAEKESKKAPEKAKKKVSEEKKQPKEKPKATKPDEPEQLSLM